MSALMLPTTIKKKSNILFSKTEPQTAEILILKEVKIWAFCYITCSDSFHHQNLTRLKSKFFKQGINSFITVIGKGRLSKNMVIRAFFEEFQENAPKT